MRSQRFSLMLAGALAALLVILLAMSAPQRRSIAEEQAPIFYDPPPTPTPTVAPLPSAPPGLAGTQDIGTVLFADSFDSGEGPASPAWEIVDVAFVLPEDRAAWIVRDGRLAQNGTAGPTGDPRPHETLAIVGDANWTNYTISAWFYDQFNAAAGLIARRQGSSFYRFMIIANDYPVAPRVLLERVVDGKATVLASQDIPGYERMRWYRISMTVNGSRISAAIDGAPVLEASDSTLVSGQAGLFTYALGGMLFDNVRVTTP